jgi:Tfp pilus assembly protein PilX
MASRLRAHLPGLATFALPERARALGKRLRQEEGIALVMALSITVVMIIFVASMVTYVTSNSVAGNTSKGRASAYTLAEAGINDAISKIYAQVDANGDEIGAGPKSSTLLASTTYSYLGGSVTFSGTISAGFVWTITSTGTVTSGGKTQTKTLTRTVSVVGTNQGADAASWSRFYQDSTTPCLTIDSDVFVTNVATRGDLCIKDLGGVTGAGTNVDVGGNVFITGPTVTSPVHSPSAGTGWTTPTNVYTSNSVYATNAIAAGATGANEDATGFGFALPPGAKILGISASVQRMASACCNAVQTISESGGPTSGSFTLKGTPPGGFSTNSAAIAYNASAATVQTALVTIYGSGNVTCTGGPLPANVVCTFAGSDAAKAVTLMSLNTNSLLGGVTPKPVFTNTTTGSTSALQDSTVQLLQAGAPVGTNKASATAWGTSIGTVNYGSAADLWGTTWTVAQVNASNFGLRFAAKNVAAASSTASLDYVSIAVTYIDDINGIGTAVTPIAAANIGGTCTYNAGTAHTPCTSADHVYATAITKVAEAANPALDMPAVDFTKWWRDAMPGPKHFCTNPNPGLATNFFDNDAAIAGTDPNRYTTGSTTAPNGSVTVNGEMAPKTATTQMPSIDYTCQVWSGGGTSGTLLGELSWNHTTHILKIFGTIFVDGNFRFDEDGEIIHYTGRATLMSSRDDEIDALVCAGGTGLTYATSCLTNMASWDASQNEMVLMSQANNEYDQGGTSCAGNTPPTCYNGHLPGGFQGIMYSTADCLIHQNFMDSGPVICNTITLPNEGGINPTFFSFPSVGNLTDGQRYSDTATAHNFTFNLGPQSG